MVARPIYNLEAPNIPRIIASSPNIPRMPPRIMFIIIEAAIITTRMMSSHILVKFYRKDAENAEKKIYTQILADKTDFHRYNSFILSQSVPIFLICANLRATKNFATSATLR